MYHSIFHSKKDEYRRRARAIGLRLEPYEVEEARSMSSEHILKIRQSVISISDKWNEEEYAFFVSEPLVKMIIENRKLEVKYTYLQACDYNLQDLYIKFFEDVDACKRDVRFNGTFSFTDDYKEYLEKYTICNYSHAIRLGKVDEYFSGVGIFPLKESSRRIIYANDYDEYISQLSHVEYFELIVQFRNRVPAKDQTYDNPVTFVDTALDQIEKYIEVLRVMEEPIYIPGDGIGAGSYACKVLGKQYFSSEPNLIGKEARLCGLISSSNSFNLLDARGCKSVFLANVVKYLDQDVFTMLRSDNKVVQWDEQPILHGKWYNGGDVRLWFNYYTEPMIKETKLKYDRILLNLSKKFNLVASDNLCRAALRKLDIKKNNKSPLLISTHPKIGIPSYCILTRGFNFDAKNGHVGQIKDFVTEQIKWSSNGVLLDGYCGKLPLQQYENKVLKNPSYDGYFYILKEKVPGYKKYLEQGNSWLKIVLVSHDKVTHESRYMLNSDFGYRSKITIYDDG